MSVGAPLVRAAARLAGWAKQARGLADDATEAAGHLRAAGEAIKGLGEGVKTGAKLETAGVRLKWSYDSFVKSHDGFKSIFANIAGDTEKTLKVLRRAAANPNISAETRAAIEAKRQALARGMDAMRARQGIEGAAHSTDAIVDAINAGRYAELPALIDRTARMTANALEVAEQAAVALEETAVLLEAEAARAAARASITVGAGVTVTTLTASEAQASYSRDNTDLAAGTYDQVNLDGAMLGLIVGVPYEAWAKAADQHALNQAKYNAELNVDAFIGESRQVDDARFESTAPSIRTIPDQKVLPIKSKSKVVWELAEEGKNLPASNQPLPSIVPRG